MKPLQEVAITFRYANPQDNSKERITEVLMNDEFLKTASFVRSKLLAAIIENGGTNFGHATVQFEIE
jgi:hypothetical protein